MLRSCQRAGTLLAVLVLASTAARPLHAQVAASYPAFYTELREMQTMETRSAPVHDVTLRRDGAEIVFQEGRIWQMSPANGRTIALAFKGSGVFRYEPSTKMEQERLGEVRHEEAMNEPFSEVILLFADSTLEELERKVTFGPGDKNDGLERRLREALSYLGREDGKSLDPDFVITLLNGTHNDLFYAHMVGRGDPWMFWIDPHEVEGVRLLGRSSGASVVRLADIITQSRRPGEDPLDLTAERLPEARVRQYQIESWMTQDLAGDLTFKAAAKLDVVADGGAGPWIAFSMYEKLEVDSARLASGQLAEVFKDKQYNGMVVRLDQALAPGASTTLTLYYHGNVIDRFGGWFFINSSIAWYPVSLEGRARALFDLTFHYP
jgi:hypothetical protein